MAEQTLELRLLKKSLFGGGGRPRIRYPASEKLKIIQLVEGSSLPVKRTLEKLGISRPTFYRWCDRYLQLGQAGLKLHHRYGVSGHFGNGIGTVRTEPERTGCDIHRRTQLLCLRAQCLQASEISRPDHQLWQTSFTYLKVIGWGWFYLSTILDDYSRYIITWKLCTGMAASDVQSTLNQALKETGLEQTNIVHHPRLLSDNGPCYISGELADYLKD